MSSVATSPIRQHVGDSAELYVLQSMKRPPGTLLAFGAYTQLPPRVWRMLMESWTPIDLLNLAAAAPLFKDLITKSPKKWVFLRAGEASQMALVKDKPKPDTFQLLGCRPWWEPEIRYVFKYGDSYAHHRRTAGDTCSTLQERCFHVDPDEDRDKPARRELHTLLNNAVLDQYGLGGDWMLPAFDQYKSPPYIRVDTALLQIKGPKDALIKQLASMDPSCVAMHADPIAVTGTFGSEVFQVIADMPHLKKMWLGFGSNVSELSILPDVRIADMDVYVSLVCHKRWRCPDWKTIQQFDIVMPSILSKIIKQWKRGERDMEHISVNFYDHSRGCKLEWRTIDPCLQALAEKACRGHGAERYRMQRSQFGYLIRKNPTSNDALLVAMLPTKILLITCNYAIRRERDCAIRYAYIQAATDAEEAIRSAFGGQEMMKEELRSDETKNGHAERKKNADPLAARRRCEALLKDWAATPLHDTLPAKELAIDRAMHGFAGNGRCRMFRDDLDYECVDDRVLNAYKQLLDPPRSFYP